MAELVRLNDMVITLYCIDCSRTHDLLPDQVERIVYLNYFSTADFEDYTLCLYSLLQVSASEKGWPEVQRMVNKRNEAC